MQVGGGGWAVPSCPSISNERDVLMRSQLSLGIPWVGVSAARPCEEQGNDEPMCHCAVERFGVVLAHLTVIETSTECHPRGAKSGSSASRRQGRQRRQRRQRQQRQCVRAI